MNDRDELARVIRWNCIATISDTAARDAAAAVLAAGYRKPKPPTTEAIESAAHAIYAKTRAGTQIAWDLLPRIVQHEIREMALTAINTFTEAQQ
jgi:hypothetical protein